MISGTCGKCYQWSKQCNPQVSQGTLLNVSLKNTQCFALLTLGLSKYFLRLKATFPSGQPTGVGIGGWCKRQQFYLCTVSTYTHEHTHPSIFNPGKQVIIGVQGQYFKNFSQPGNNNQGECEAGPVRGVAWARERGAWRATFSTRAWIFHSWLWVAPKLFLKKSCLAVFIQI